MNCGGGGDRSGKSAHLHAANINQVTFRFTVHFMQYSGQIPDQVLSVQVDKQTDRLLSPYQRDIKSLLCGEILFCCCGSHTNQDCNCLENDSQLVSDTVVVEDQMFCGIMTVTLSHYFYSNYINRFIFNSSFNLFLNKFNFKQAS